MSWKHNFLTVVMTLVFSLFASAGGSDPWPLFPAPMDDIDTSTPWVPEDDESSMYKIEKYKVSNEYIFVRISEVNSATGKVMATGAAVISANQSEAKIRMKRNKGDKYPLRLVSFYEDVEGTRVGLGITKYKNFCGQDKVSFILRQKNRGNEQLDTFGLFF